MNSETSTDITKKVLIVVSDLCTAPAPVIALLMEKYGDRVEVIRESEMERYSGIEIDFMLLDDAPPVKMHDVIVKGAVRPVREYWQRSRY